MNKRWRLTDYQPKPMTYMKKLKTTIEIYNLTGYFIIKSGTVKLPDFKLKDKNGLTSV